MAYPPSPAHAAGRWPRSANGAKLREGLEPNGRDGKDGTGRSPQSPAALRADTPRPFHILKKKAKTSPCPSSSGTKPRPTFLPSRRSRLLGDPAYYARFGFEAHAGLHLPGVPPGLFMALALEGPVPEGIAQYSDAINAAA